MSSTKDTSLLLQPRSVLQSATERWGSWLGLMLAYGKSLDLSDATPSQCFEQHSTCQQAPDAQQTAVCAAAMPVKAPCGIHSLLSITRVTKHIRVLLLASCRIRLEVAMHIAYIACFDRVVYQICLSRGVGCSNFLSTSSSQVHLFIPQIEARRLQWFAVSID